MNLEMPFPFGGLNLEQSAAQQPEGTTAVARNVRAFDQSQRQRGGSRAGISRFIDEAVGSGHIQHLNLIVSTHADALGWSFGGRDFGFTGIYGGIGFFGGSFGSDEANHPEGGGGYQTQDSDRYDVSMTVDDTMVPPDGVSDATITVTVEEQPGSPPDTPHTVELRTNFPGRVGDRAQGQTDSGGQVRFNVTDTREESVVYTARDITARVRAGNRVTVNFVEGDITFLQAAYDTASNSFGTNSPALAFSLSVQAGSLIVVFFGNGSGHDDLSGATVTDSLGTTYTWAGAGIVTATTMNISAWWGRTNASGANTVTINLFPVGHFAPAFAIAEYSGTNANPFDNVSTNFSDDQVLAFTTGSIPISVPGAVIGGFYTGFKAGTQTLSVDSGFVERVNAIDDPPNYPKIVIADKLLVSSATEVTITSNVISRYAAVGMSFK